MKKKLIIGYASDELGKKNSEYNMISKSINEYAKSKSIKSIKLVRFSTIERFINYISNSCSLDIGIVNFVNNKNFFLFITVEYSSFTGTSTLPFPYLIYKLSKPINLDILGEIMDNEILYKKKYNNNYCFLNDSNGFRKIYFHDIYYIETYGRYIHIYTVNGLLPHNINLKSIECHLSEGFYRCHGSYIINLNYISIIVGLEIKLIDGSIIPIGKHKRRSFLEYYKKYINYPSTQKNGNNYLLQFQHLN